MTPEWEAARLDETAEVFNAHLLALSVLVGKRRGRKVTIRLDDVPEVTVHARMNLGEGTLTVWLEEPDPESRPGVSYIRYLDEVAS